MKCRNCGNELRLGIVDISIGMGDTITEDAFYCDTCGKYWTLIVGDEVKQ